MSDDAADRGAALPPPPPDVDPSDELPVPPGARHAGSEAPIEDAEVVDVSEGVEDPIDAEPEPEPQQEAANDSGREPVDAAGPAPDPDPVAGDATEQSPAMRRPILPAAEPARSRLIAGTAAAAVALLGLLGAVIAGGGGGLDRAERPTDPPAAATSEPATVTEPDATASPSTGGPATTAAIEPPSTPAVADTPPASAPITTSAAVGGGATTLLPDPSATTTTVPGSAQLVGRVVPDVAAYPEALDDVAQAQRIAELATTARNDVASPGPVGSLCAVVRLQEQAQLEGRWERDGDEVDSTNLSTVGEPGFGDCLVAEDGTPLEEGTYQFIVADRDGNDSAAGTFVVGAVPLEQIFVNTSTEQVCVLRLGPSSAGRYDAYDFGDAPLVPGASVVVPIADVDHEVRVDGCDPAADPIAEFDFNPAAGVPQPLVD